MLKPLASLDRHPINRWLMTDARKVLDPSIFLEDFANELRSSGVDASRITTGVPILHPQIFSFSGLWELGKETTERQFRAGSNFSEILGHSPIRIAYQGGGLVRCNLVSPAEPGEFAILSDLRQDGYTDYVVYAVPFSDGPHKALSLAAKSYSGFTADELTLFEVMIPARKSRRYVALHAHCWTPTLDNNRAAGYSWADPAGHGGDHPRSDLVV